jgi:hypothetical protein
MAVDLDHRGLIRKQRLQLLAEGVELLVSRFHVHKSMNLINPIIKVVLGFFFISRLLGTSRKTIWVVRNSRYVD